MLTLVYSSREENTRIAINTINLIVVIMCIFSWLAAPHHRLGRHTVAPLIVPGHHVVITGELHCDVEGVTDEREDLCEDEDRAALIVVLDRHVVIEGKLHHDVEGVTDGRG